MSTRGRSRISIVETNLPVFALQRHTYVKVSERLRKLDFVVFYEYRTSILTQGQSGLYDNILSNVPNDLKVFLYPIIVSFVHIDTCDISDTDYVWLDLDGDEVGCSVWLKREGQDTVLDKAIYLLEWHLEKYVIDVYDWRTRKGMLWVWEVQLDLQECAICGNSSPCRRLLDVTAQKLQGWLYSNCGHRTVFRSDVLILFKGRIEYG